ncbi:MAG: endo-1,4-beta-xylanase [Chthonomonadales bacterium]
MILPPLLVLAISTTPISVTHSQNPIDPIVGANERIKRIRMAIIEVKVVDSSGEPIPGVKVTIEQTGHKFLFGCAAISLMKHASASEEQQYKNRFADLFNFATVLTYWPDTNPTPTTFETRLLDTQVAWLNENNITVKGHPLFLAGSSPGWADQNPSGVRNQTEQRVEQIVNYFKGKIEIWDAVGDSTTARNARNGLGAWARSAGVADLTADMFGWAHKSDPSATLLYNDYNLDQKYLDLITDLKRRKSSINVIGLEAHMGYTNWPLIRVWETAETFKKLGFPIHFSEITVLSNHTADGQIVSDPNNLDGESVQADYVEKMYTLLFSHPSVSAIAWWNFVDGDWDTIPSGLLKRNLTPKKAYSRLLHLIKTKWWTKSSGASDWNGTFKVRGFLGKYKVSVTTSSGVLQREIDLDRSGQGLTIQLP